MRLFLASNVKIPAPARIIQDAADAIGHISWGFDAIRTSFYVASYFEQQASGAICGPGDVVCNVVQSSACVGEHRRASLMLAPSLLDF